MSSETSEYTDEDLVQRSLEDANYFGQLIQRYEDKLRRYLSRLGNFTKEDLEDLLQNIFIKIYQNINAFDPSLKFSSWAYRITHNEAVSMFRHNSSRPQGHAAEVSDEVFTNILSESDIEGEFKVKESGEHLTSAIYDLPEKYRDIIILHYFEYKSYDEISDILRLPVGTVAVRLRRGKQNLQKILKRNGYEYE